MPPTTVRHQQDPQEVQGEGGAGQEVQPEPAEQHADRRQPQLDGHAAVAGTRGLRQSLCSLGAGSAAGHCEWNETNLKEPLFIH